MELASAIDEFIDDRQSLDRARNTIKFYRANLRRVQRYMAGIDVYKLEALDRHVIRTFFAHLSQQQFSRGTICAYDRVLRAFFRFCRDERWIDQSPMANRPRIKPPRSLPDTWEMDEIERILTTCKDDVTGIRDRAAILLLLDTGIRAGELSGLRPCDVDMNGDRGLVTVRAATSKSDEDRMIPFWSETLLALHNWTAIRPDADTLFVAFDGARQMTLKPFTPGGMYQMMRRRVKEAGVKKRRRLCHIWRHTFAKNYVIAGGDLETLRRMLGHKTLETVRIYLGFKTKELEDKHFQLSPVRRLFATKNSPSQGSL